MQSNHARTKLALKPVLLLAAGKGVRLRPLTLENPKPLITLDDKYLIQHHLEKLSHLGVQQVYVNRAYLRHRFEQLLDKNNCYGIDIVYLDEPDEALETAGAIINAFQHMPKQDNNEEIVVINSDIWTNFDYGKLLQAPLDKSVDCHLVLVDNPAHNPDGDFAIDNKKATLRLMNKSDDAGTKNLNYTFSGIGVYKKSLFSDALLAQKEISPLPLKPIILEAIKQQKAQAEVHSGLWFDIGTIERLSEAETAVRALRELNSEPNKD